ncbi:glycoside hydrolase family 3 protein [Mangrovimicrobium sediminis]|uniref:Glycoside hydrolase family 3 protein n=1 Tax=Mangrovimicrobium sediminis TaxID=2562682 RepID=A0A4Z0LXF4_9GAMM|nr:glycoside hydrolase family 3 protein [Haliea sp. SAOS-164]TGD71838.1 glycoside hydrolase family 3 protein [Haliea sp. SAOS-164]
MPDSPQPSLERCIALRLMPDIRRYAEHGAAQPVRVIPPSLAAGLARLQPGGVILFRENLVDIGQARELIAELRELSSGLLVGVDQEGGRVTRLPREACTSFTGAMALAACPEPERSSIAGQFATAQAEELRALGFNLNFAPCLDVNSNPLNPVIHVRSFGDDPALVARLGGALVTAMQTAGVAACVKHFPGHGDTCEDSHTGLPRVDRSREEAGRIDLAPFASVFASARPATLMSAHIQYPALDASTLPGSDVVRPATLSRAIITDLLRTQMGYRGVVISDALDMAAISELLAPEAAVLECFRAGVDIALMPLRARDPAGLDRLEALVDYIAGRVRAGELDEAEMRASAARVAALQAAYPAAAVGKPGGVGVLSHRHLEKHLAELSITCLHGTPVPLAPGTRVHLLMPDAASARAMARALTLVQPALVISSQSLDRLDIERERELARAAQHYIVGISEPAPSAVVAGGAEDTLVQRSAAPTSLCRALLEDATGVRRTVLMLGSPYPAPTFFDCAETVLASYDGAAVGWGGAPGPAFGALAEVLVGRLAARGCLPVKLPAP